MFALKSVAAAEYGPAAAQNDKTETDRPVTAAEPDQRANAEDQGRPESGGGRPERGQRLDITV